MTVLVSGGVASQDTRYSVIQLARPDKTAVWNWPQGSAIPRQAFVVLRTGRALQEALVDLGTAKIVWVKPLRGVQSNLVGAEWDRATALVKADPRWQTAMKSRGIADFRNIFCDALSIGPSSRDTEHRTVKLPCYDARRTTNVYGRPIEGLMATVDLDTNAVTEVNDRGPIPISIADPSLEEERQPTLQPKLRPIGSSAPAGLNFTVDGNIVRWAGWSFHLSFDQRVGPIVSTVRHRDGVRDRPILYEGHVSEMFVPYMDTDPNWSFRTYMDVGEYGFGTLASPLVSGADCPAGALMLPLTLASYEGKPVTTPNLMCVFERNTTQPLWRRYEIVTGAHESRQDIELVVRAIPVVGNYDYVVDWVFNLKGEIQIDVGATGVPAAKGERITTADGGGSKLSGALVGAHLSAPDHDHFLSFRLDLDVDGTTNTFVRDRLVTESASSVTGGRSRWTRRSVIVGREIGFEPPHGPELWRVENSAAQTDLGYSPSYELVGGHDAVSMLSADDPAQRRAAFSARPLWVTTYKSGERYAAGDYPNQSPAGEGLPRYVDGEMLTGKDVVVWYTMGFHHVTRPEDWPVLSTVRHKLTLRPHRFFDRNPAAAIRRQNDVKPAAPR